MEQDSRVTAAEQAALDAVGDEVVKKAASVKLLKRQVIENEAKLSSLLDVIIGDI